MDFLKQKEGVPSLETILKTQASSFSIDNVQVEEEGTFLRSFGDEIQITASTFDNM